jgi:LysM repeat protein
MADQEKTVSQIMRVITITPGDTLSSIAAQYYGDESLASELAAVNGIAINAILTVGTKVHVPRRVTFAKKRLPHKPAGLGDDPVMIDPSVQSGVPLVTVTGTMPWYLQPHTWIIAGVGVVLAYLLLTPKKTRRN